VTFYENLQTRERRRKTEREKETGRLNTEEHDKQDHVIRLVPSDLHNIEPISDTEEDREVLRSIRTGKRRMSLSSSHSDQSDQNDDVVIPLPTMAESEVKLM
jgi:hypothetical protein